MLELADAAKADQELRRVLTERLRAKAVGLELEGLITVLGNVDPAALESVIADVIRRVRSDEDLHGVAQWALFTNSAAAIPALGDRLAQLIQGSFDEPLRDRAIKAIVMALGNIDHLPAEPTLRRSLLVAGAPARYTGYAARTIGSVREPETIRAFVASWRESLIEEPNGRARIGEESGWFSVALGRSESPDALGEALAAGYQASERKGEREALLSMADDVARRSGTSEPVLQMLLTGLASADPSVQVHAAMSLAALPGWGDAPVAEKLLDTVEATPSEMVRRSAILALASVRAGNPSAFARALARFNATEDLDTRLLLCMHLLKYPEALRESSAVLEELESVLRRCLAEPSTLRAQGCAAAIGDLSVLNRASAREFARRLSQTLRLDPSARPAQIRMWAAFLPELEAVNAIGQIATDPREPATTRAAAVKSFRAAAGSRAATAYLKTIAVETDDPVVLRSVARILALLPADHEVLRSLAERLSDWDKSKRDLLAGAILRGD